jgi:ubiquitin carboxyl-terminal hydrolase 1
MCQLPHFQAMASLTYLQPHIDSIHAKAEALDVPTPVIDALKELFRSKSAHL